MPSISSKDAKSFVATVGQIVLTSPQTVLRQMETIFQNNAESELFVFPEFAAHSDSVDMEIIAYLNTDNEAKTTARRWYELSPRASVVEALADKFGKAVLFGSLHQEGDVLFSRCVYYDPIERARAFYDKTHVHWTEKFLCPGHRLEPINTRFGRIGVLICHDTAFAEAARVLGVQGADILCTIAATPRGFDWRYVHTRLAGAAINNQYYVLGSHLGDAPKARMGGHSVIFAPDARMCAAVSHEQFGAASATIDYEAMRRWREAEKTALHRRPELYAPLTRKPPDR